MGSHTHINSSPESHCCVPEVTTEDKMADIKLRYFNARGRAECIRWVLEYAGAQYEDVRFEREAWPEEKKKMLTGMVPELEYDGFTLGETNAIVSFLGKELKLAGKDHMEEARCEMIANMITDFMAKGGKLRVETDEAKKKALKAEFMEQTIPQFFGLMVKMLEVNKGKTLVGNGVTYADIILVCLLDSITHFDPQAAKMQLPPPLDQLNKMIRENPKIKAWLEKRPATMF